MPNQTATIFVDAFGFVEIPIRTGRYHDPCWQSAIERLFPFGFRSRRQLRFGRGRFGAILSFLLLQILEHGSNIEVESRRIGFPHPAHLFDNWIGLAHDSGSNSSSDS